jgi:hypothetical protein
VAALRARAATTDIELDVPAVLAGGPDAAAAPVVASPVVASPVVASRAPHPNRRPARRGGGLGRRPRSSG